MGEAVKEPRTFARKLPGELHRTSQSAPACGIDEKVRCSRDSLEDAILAGRAERALRAKDFRFSRCVRCTCERGVLVLAGRVPTYYLKQLAQVAAAQVDGIEQIDNRLDVFLPDGESFSEGGGTG